MKTFLYIVTLIAALLSCTAQAANNILVFGDSLSAGYGIARDASWVNLLQHELKKDHLRFEVVNASISGETTAGGLRRIGMALRQHHPAIVIVELGANDGLRGATVAETERNLNMIIEQIKQTNAKVLLLGMRLPPNYGSDYTRQFHAIFPKLAKRHGVTLLPFLLDGIPPEQFQADNLHPTAEAQPLIMHNVMKLLMPLLRP
jgi:acyl-CoA thioesterase I